MNNELNLIKIHKRRMNVLLEQQAKRGISQGATVTIEIENIQQYFGD